MDPMSQEELNEVLARLRQCRSLEWSRLARIRAYLQNDVTGDIFVPQRATQEYRDLVSQARFNILGLVVTAVAQNLFVDGYRPTGPNGRAPTSDNSPIWDKAWQANRMDKRQAGLYRAAIRYGVSYATVARPMADGGAPKITPFSPFRLTALYEDEINDEWPRYAMTVEAADVLTGQPALTVDPAMTSSSITGPVRVKIYDQHHVYTLTTKDNSGGDRSVQEIESVAPHGFPVTPVVRFLDEFDLDGVPPGKVEPLIPAQQQLNQTSFSLLMTQHYQAFRQRWATGLAIELDDNGQPKEPYNSAVDTLWTNESADAKFGDFAQTDLGGYLDSRDKTLLYVASAAQIPPHNLLVGSGISNISAETLAAIEAGHRMDIGEHETSFGESVEQVLRLCGYALDDMDTWNDESAQVVWRDTTPRSLGQVVDALGKLASMLGVPVQALWERIPNTTDQDIARWLEMATEADVMNELADMVANDPPGPAADELDELGHQADAA